MEHADFNQGLLEFLNQSPTPWHAVATMKAKLDEAGFQALDEREDWSLAANSGYYVIRNGSSLVAFRTALGTRRRRACVWWEPTPTVPA